MLVIPTPFDTVTEKNMRVKPTQDRFWLMVSTSGSNEEHLSCLTGKLSPFSSKYIAHTEIFAIPLSMSLNPLHETLTTRKVTSSILTAIAAFAHSLLEITARTPSGGGSGGEQSYMAP